MKIGPFLDLITQQESSFLKSCPEKMIDAKKMMDKNFVASGEAQLDWIYRNSEYYEKAHLQYPIYRIK